MTTTTESTGSRTSLLNRDHYTILQCHQSPLLQDNGKFFVGHTFFEQDKYYRYVIDSGPFATREQAERVIEQKTKMGPAILTDRQPCLDEPACGTGPQLPPAASQKDMGDLS